MSKGKILIVDDNVDAVATLKDRLEFEGYELEYALDGFEALKSIKKSKPDLVLLDVMMPQQDGFTVCFKLKNNPETKDIPIIMLTAKSLMSDMEQGMKMGAETYVVKPFDMEVLLKKIDKYIKKPNN